MRFGVFDYIEAGDIPLDQTYEERLTLIQSLEAADFYGYHLSEHHATPLSMTPSPSIFLAAAARETKRIRLGTLLYLLPLYHPMRLLEELCMLDQLSGGRLDIGIGRGISPHEFEAFDTDFADSGADFDHCFNVLHQGFTRDRINYSSPNFTFKDVPVVLRSKQQPHPPFWYGLRGEHGPVFAAKHGMNGVTLGPDDRVSKIIQSFREEWALHADERKALSSPVISPFVGVMRAMFIADTDAEAERIARKAHGVWFDNLAWLWKVRGTFPPIAIAPDFDQARAAGTLVAGSPDTVARIFKAQAERCGHNYLVLLLAFGSLTHQEQMRSLELFRTEVMPKLADTNEETVLGGASCSRTAALASRK
ncbi:MAG: LLM class flavin-dependent oxidoreductase [Alphaproteobacteria bacterium]|nr:LLM class flavin-dependent oxidoreductase [Alphaproteobacteria bacterium]